MVIPFADRNPTRTTPWVTWLIVLANVVAFVLLTPWWADACSQIAFYAEWAAIPAEIIGNAPIAPSQVPGGAQCGLGAATDKSVAVSLLTAMFLHGGWMHLGLNMLYLWIFGNNVEDRLGHVRFAAFYLATGVVATLAFAVANAGSPVTLVGASGAIAGVLGAYLVIFPRARVYSIVPFLFFLVLPLPAWLVLGLWFVGQLGALRVGELAGSNVAYLAHVAGFVAGVASAWLVRPARLRRRGVSGRAW